MHCNKKTEIKNCDGADVMISCICALPFRRKICPVNQKLLKEADSLFMRQISVVSY